MCPKRSDFDVESYIDVPIPRKTAEAAFPTAGMAVTDRFQSTDYVKSKALSLYKQADRMPSGQDVSCVGEGALLKMLQDVSAMSMTIRTGVLGYKDGGYADRRKEVLKCLPVVVGVPQNAIVRVSIPPLVGRRITGSYDVYQYTKMALEDFMQTHPLAHCTGKMLLVYKKYAENLSINYTCDNDNWEAKRVTNAICEALNYSDNAEHFGMMYTAVKSCENYVEATVLPMQNLGLFLDYLTDPHPAQPLQKT